MPRMKRLELHNLLVGTIGSNNVYFQPPETVKMQYPCVIYHTSYIDTSHADNTSYITHYRYLFTYVTRNPDDENIEKLKLLPATKFDRYYTADNLHHYSYEITMF